MIDIIDQMLDEGQEQEAIVLDSGYATDLTFIADYLLQNGVIVPPCNVGDTVYILWPPNQDDAQIIRGEVIGFSFGMKDEVYISNINYCGCFCRPFSKVFVYREDAEQALKGMETDE